MAPSGVAAQIAKPNCPDHCGDVEIPYPFGTTKSCAIDHYFFINCTNLSGNFRPLTSDGLFVQSISIHGQLDIVTFTAYDCYNETGLQYHNRPFLRPSPNFPISTTQNKFVAVGCDTYAFLNGFRNNEPFSIGCTSTCESITNVINGSCSGIGCCQVEIPKGLKNFTLSARSYENHTSVLSFNPCSYAFVTKQDLFNFSSAYLDSPIKYNRSVPVVLDWAIGNDTCVNARTRFDYACGGHSTCYDSNNRHGYRCKCEEGYDGNPYLPDGCQDIDECKTRNPYKDSNQICTNIAGRYDCSCREEYEAYYMTDGTAGCRAKVHQSKIICIALGVSISLLVLLVGGSWIYWGLKRRKLMKLKEKFFIQNGGFILQQQRSNHRGSVEIVKIFSTGELEKATNNYDQRRILGEGGYGTVYKGVLSDNKIEQFINEVIVLAQINHRNVVKLLGCCLETEVPLLVYEFITNGTLSNHIHDRTLSFSLLWKERLKIAAEIAGALAYLHSETSIPIIHRDVKSTNILLDDHRNAKVADFGASRLVPLDQTQLTTLVQGTLGYLDPEYFQTSQLTEKSDVYSFGVVMAELLTGKKALSMDRPENDRNLANCLLSAIKEDCLLQILDDQIVKEDNIEELKDVANLAKRCLTVRGEDRPTMKEVAMELEGLRSMEKHPWGKANLSTEETEYLLNKPAESFNIDIGNGTGSSTSTTAGYESMRNQLLNSLNNGR
ncbi:Wall-associated receptor kinase 2 [Morella rubra]|uniref:Wall-associated receptor kinase 2 n=1 Tax=Morella rubra TaxID=262757 RepID=A0A6A1W7M7_9ROSI|nr:Wall-associated receptor kinase 2 [Morella rubra]